MTSLLRPTVNVLKFQTLFPHFLCLNFQILLVCHFFLKILSGTANSVDSDQTTPSGVVRFGSALFAYCILSDTLVYKILGHFP